ncbi:sigma-54-dependent transcriptional regulator [Fundidesulfovibrio terrae]|uniref:sigma-54-dependent transcriptional regulator n=1 Tax=Fundidesulfovibrio terrae TaxID=2922866 RepID=UPI001FAEB733|nr:sigma-54 dependent transcriptional regulator [Fundidesulfovibrio terrae]
MSASPTPLNPILLVDDEEQALRSYDLNLRYSGLTNTIRCSDPREVKDILRSREVSLVMLDLSMPQMRGEDVLSFIKSEYPHVPVIIVTGFDEVETAVRCMRAGSADYLVKPVDRAHLLSAVRHALEARQAPAAPAQAKQDAPAGTDDPLASIVTVNPGMKSMLAYVQAVAASDEPVLVAGETGVGKELVARAIHGASGLRGKFVAVNVAGLDDAMFSDTLFGHKKGAFTGANIGRRGLIEEAAGGTLFLDEIGDLPKNSQLKLLRLIQEREYYPLGSDAVKPMEARIIVATNVALEDAIEQGTFRRDLFFRLRTHYVRIPPLRSRMDDLGPLTRHFLEKAAERLGKEPPKTPTQLAGLLGGHAFPGNVRELEAMIFNAVALCEGGVLPLEPIREWIGSVRGRSGAELFPAVLEEGAAAVPTLKQIEERTISDALRKAGGNQSVAAKMLGITRQALNRRLLTKKRKATSEDI